MLRGGICIFLEQFNCSSFAYAWGCFFLATGKNVPVGRQPARDDADSDLIGTLL